MSSFKELACPWVSRLGVYEPGRPIEEVAREVGLASADAIIKLASNENALGPSPKAVAAMRQQARRMHLYPDGGAFYLREGLANHLNVAPGQVLVGSGSNELIEFIGHVFLDAGVNLVMADRAFVVYKLVGDLFRAETIMAPMKQYTHDLDAMLAAITPQTRVVFIANPNNPTGTMVNGAELDAFLHQVPDHVVTVIDEAYIELLAPVEQPDTLKHVRAGRKVVLLRTFSKMYGLAGLRIGYAIAPEACIELLARVRQPFNTTSMGQAAALAALEDEAHVQRTRRLVKEGLAYFEAAFRKMGLEYVPSVANFILVKVGRGREVFESMQRKGVIVRCMDPYRLPDHIRITTGTPRENRRCIKVLAEVLMERDVHS